MQCTSVSKVSVCELNSSSVLFLSAFGRCVSSMNGHSEKIRKGFREFWRLAGRRTQENGDRNYYSTSYTTDQSSGRICESCGKERKNHKLIYGGISFPGERRMWNVLSIIRFVQVCVQWRFFLYSFSQSEVDLFICGCIISLVTANRRLQEIRVVSHDQMANWVDYDRLRKNLAV